MTEFTIIGDGMNSEIVFRIAKAVRNRTASPEDAERLRTGVVVPAVIAQCGHCGTHWKVADLPGPAESVVQLGLFAAEAGCPDCGRKDKVYTSQAVEAVAWWVTEGCHLPPIPVPDKRRGKAALAGTVDGDVVLPEGRLLRVETEIRLPAAATKAQVEEWLNLEFGVGGCSDDNPLSRYEMEPWDGEYLITDTGFDGRREEFDHEPTESGGTRYRVRFVRTPAR